MKNKKLLMLISLLIISIFALSACGPKENDAATTSGESTDWSTVNLLEGKGPTTSLSTPPTEKFDYPYVGGGEKSLGWPYEIRPLTYNNSQIIIMANAIVVQPNITVDYFNFYLPDEVALMETGDTLTLTFGAHILNLTKKGSGNSLDLKKVTYQGELSNYATVNMTFMDVSEFPYLMPEMMSAAYLAEVTAQEEQ